VRESVYRTSLAPAGTGFAVFTGRWSSLAFFAAAASRGIAPPSIYRRCKLAPEANVYLCDGSRHRSATDDDAYG